MNYKIREIKLVRKQPFQASYSLTSSSIDAKKINSNTEIITAIEIIANFLLSIFRVIIY